MTDLSYVIQESITRNGRFEPFELQVARDQITEHSPNFYFGFANSIGTTQQTITTSVTAGSLYVYPATATIMKVSSSSANDTAAGTGARTLSADDAGSAARGSGVCGRGSDDRFGYSTVALSGPRARRWLLRSPPGPV